MSAQIETVQALYAAFGRGDVAAILARLDPDVEWEHDWVDPLRWFVPRRGRDAVIGFFEALGDFEFLRFEPTAYLEGGNQVCVPIHIALRVKATGRVIRDLEAHLWTFGPGGQVVRMRHLVDTHQYVQAAVA